MSLVGPARHRPVAVAHLGLRTRSTVVADALSLAATTGCSAEDLARLVDEDVEGLDGVVADDAALAGLALLWAGHEDPARTDRGALLYGWLAASGRLPELPVHHQATAQALLLSGRARELRELLPALTRIPAPVRHDVEVDLARPGREDPPGGDRWQAWEGLLSARFTDRGLVPVRVRAEGPETHLFDRLTAAAPRGPGGGTLVTVVVPCWRPDEGLLGSVASLTAQSHPDLEIVVVDDASGPGYEHLFDAVLRSDERVTLLRLDVNGGSYLARRAALEVSRGSVFTTQDADDWSHPQRIEHQLGILEEHPSAPASRSLAVRAKDDLTHQWFGYRAVRDNASSLMVRRDVAERAGTFLPLRKSADSEYAERLQVLVGPVVDTGSPLAITRLRTGSLSRGDFTYQWSDPDRIAFRGTYRAWHRSLGERPDRPPVDADMPEVPPAFVRGLPGAQVVPGSVELAVLGDFSGPPGRAEEDARLLLARRGDRGTVALWHLEGPSAAAPSRPEMHPGWYDLVLELDHLHLLTRTRPTHARTLVVLEPAALTVATDQPTRTTADRVLVALRPADVEPASTADRAALPGLLPLDLLAVSDACHRWWGSRPDWVVSPGSSVDDLRRLEAALPGLVVDPAAAAAPWPVEAGR